MGSDHGGLELRKALKEKLIEEGHTVIDHGTNTKDSVDYPDYAAMVAKDIIEKKADFGVLMCTTGIGVSISANKFHGVRAAKVDCDDEAEFSRRHNNANVLVLGGRMINHEYALKITELWLNTPFDGGRHLRRVDKIHQLSGL